jgi:hypothetical protein
MKLVKIIVLAAGLCLGNTLYAEDAFTVLGTRPDSREPDLTNPAIEWGSNAGKGTYQKLMRYVTRKGVTTATPMPDTYIPGLKTKSGVAFAPGAEGLVAQVWPLPNGDVLFSTEIVPGNSNYLYKMSGSTGTVGNNAAHNNKRAVMNMGERGAGTVADIRALHHRSLLVVKVNSATVLFFGEFNINSTTPHVALWKSVDMGDNWSKVIEWNTVGHQVAHIHGVVQNPYNGWIYLLFGDQDSESGIVAWDGKSTAPPDNTPLDQIGNSRGWKSLAHSPRVRTGDLVFTPPPNGKCVWIPDVDSINRWDNPWAKLVGQRANYDLTDLEATGEIPYSDGIVPILGARSDSSGNIYWTSYRNTGITKPPEKKLHVWKSTDAGLSWRLVAKVDTLSANTSVPQDLIVKGSVSATGVITDNLLLSARTPQLAPHAGNQGSTVLFSNTSLAADSPITCLLNWAEGVYPDSLAPAGAMSQVQLPYIYRYYEDSNSYAGVSSDDNHAYYMGPDRMLQDVGVVSDWFKRSGCDEQNNSLIN